jgi:hypothetical protein
MEPTTRTCREIGRLCIAYAALESEVECTVWGILDLDGRIGPIVTGRQDLRNRFQIILEYAERKHTKGDIVELKEINKWLTPIMRDRNIVVHGLVSATIVQHGPLPQRGTIVAQPFVFGRTPCWTITKGGDAGKSFPVSPEAVTLIRNNIGKVSDRLMRFNQRFNYRLTSQQSDIVEQGWPKSLE